METREENQEQQRESYLVATPSIFVVSDLPGAAPQKGILFKGKLHGERFTMPVECDAH